AAVGSHLAFAAFGARAAAACGAEHGAALALGFLPLPWALAAGLATEAALRFAWHRLPEDRIRRIAFAGKLAVGCGVGLGLLAGLVAQGDPSNRGSGFASSLNGGEVWFYSTVLIWFWSWAALRRRGVPVLSGVPERIARLDQPETSGVAAAPGAGQAAGIGRLGRLAGEGAALFAALAAGLAVLGLIFALVVTEGLHERIGLLFGFPVVGFSFGAALLDGAMGAGLGGVRGHTSLAQFGMPAGPDAGAAPVWVFAALLLAPGAVAAVVWRRLERERPADEQGALRVGAATAVGFTAAAWLAALLGRVVVLAAVTGPRGEAFGSAPEMIPIPARATVGTLVALRPNPAAVLALALLWGLAGGLGAAFLWASRHNARWQISGSGAATAGPPAPPARPPEEATTVVAPSGATQPAASESGAWLLPETEVRPTDVDPKGLPSEATVGEESPTEVDPRGRESAGDQEAGAGGDPPGGKP
ncbi:MAG: hypothetical protein AB1679_34335, partial [Actinomycetota bacterium]